MSKLSAIASVAFAIAAAFGVWLYAAQKPSSDGSELHSSSRVLNYPQSMQDAASPANMGTADSSPSRRLSVKPKDLILVGDETWSAKTAAQAAWLNRNFFPTREQLSLYNGRRSIAELPRDGIARSGADVVIAENIAINDPDNRRHAIAVLKNAAESGSTYALQSMARIQEKTSENPLDAEAYYRAALLRGDWLAGLRVAPRLGMEANYTADVRAYQIISEINAARRSRGLPAMQVDTRPGLHDAIELLDYPARQNGD